MVTGVCTAVDTPPPSTWDTCLGFYRAEGSLIILGFCWSIFVAFYQLALLLCDTAAATYTRASLVFFWLGAKQGGLRALLQGYLRGYGASVRHEDRAQEHARQESGAPEGAQGERESEGQEEFVPYNSSTRYIPGTLQYTWVNPEARKSYCVPYCLYVLIVASPCVLLCC